MSYFTCSGCGRRYSSERAHSAHRTGPYQRPQTRRKGGRRCMSEDEMRAAGLVARQHPPTRRAPAGETIWSMADALAAWERRAPFLTTPDSKSGASEAVPVPAVATLWDGRD